MCSEFPYEFIIQGVQMKHKINKILSVLCSSCFAWLAFHDFGLQSYLFFGEVEPPKKEND